ncbi:transglycosylase domain-containing protein [Klebsiella pneumoniae]|uniref:Transglycosylase domain-containing protein n=1 Tax=Klebsiella pneumoniae TaxID=573 RepID=A0A939SS90_KLEPN|nr:transglycosylase domain-containing protein [Klebsiella pneumoniae]
MSPRYLQALIQYEDRWFWRHPGSTLAVPCAARQILLPGELPRAAARLPCRWHACLTHPRTFGGKLRQLWRALQLEWHLSKATFLTSI